MAPRKIPARKKRGPARIDLSSVDAALASSPDSSAEDWLEVGASHEETAERYIYGDKTQREYEWALVAYRAAIQLDPNSFEACYSAARILDELGTSFYDGPAGIGALKEAISLYRRSLDTDEGQQATLRKDAAESLALVLLTLENHLSEGALDATNVSVSVQELDELKKEAVTILSDVERLMRSDLFDQSNDEHLHDVLDVQLELLGALEDAGEITSLLQRLIPSDSPRRALAVIEASARLEKPNAPQLEAAFGQIFERKRTVEAVSTLADMLLDLDEPDPVAAKSRYEEALAKLSNKLSPPDGLKPHELPALQCANLCSQSEALLLLAKRATDEEKPGYVRESLRLAMSAFQALDASRKDWSTERHRRMAIAHICRATLASGAALPQAWSTLPALSKRRAIDEFRDDAVWTEAEGVAWQAWLQ